jgi:hypothetical protein
MDGKEVGRANRFTIEFPGDDSTKKGIKERLNKVRDFFVKETERPVSNSMVLDFWLQQHLDSDHTEKIPTYTKVDREHVDQKSGLSIVNTKYLGHAVKTKLRCKRRHGNHKFDWISSSRLPNEQLLVNERIVHVQKFCLSKWNRPHFRE